MDSNHNIDKIIAINPDDVIVQAFVTNIESESILNWKCLKHEHIGVPIAFRGMNKKGLVTMCKKQNRDFYYIDTGYFGNHGKGKLWHRVVKNNVQHTTPRYDLPDDRFKESRKALAQQIGLGSSPESIEFTGWRKNGSAILLVTPSEKPCKFYGVNRDEWVKETVNELRKHTDRPIIIRDKVGRSQRVKDKSIFHQLIDDNIYAVVTYNSVAAIEAIGVGIPAFTFAPTAADVFCLKDLSRIESPLYEDEEKVHKWQNWLGYCQYSHKELTDGTALRMIQEYDLK